MTWSLYILSLLDHARGWSLAVGITAALAAAVCGIASVTYESVTAGFTPFWRRAAVIFALTTAGTAALSLLAPSRDDIAQSVELQREYFGRCPAPKCAAPVPQPPAPPAPTLEPEPLQCQ